MIYIVMVVVLVVIPSILWGKGRRTTFTTNGPAKTSTTTSTSRATKIYWKLKFKDWWASFRDDGIESDIVKAAILWVGCWVAMYAIFPVWWMARWKENSLWLTIGVGLVFLGVKFGKPAKIPISWKIGVLAKILGTFVIVFFILLKSDYGQKKAEEWRLALKNWVWSLGNEMVPADKVAGMPEGFRTSTDPGHWSNNVTDANRDIVNAVMTAVRAGLKPREHDLAMQIVWEESNFRQSSEDGNVLTNVNDDGSVDLGVFQINERTWRKTSKKLGEGYELETLDGNIRMAVYIWTALKPESQGPLEWETYEQALAIVLKANPAERGVETVLARATPPPTPVTAPTPSVVPDIARPTRGEYIVSSSLTYCPEDTRSMIDVTEVGQLPMPRGGTPTGWMRCNKPDCVLEPTEKMKYLLCGQNEYYDGSAGVPYIVGTVPFKVLDGRMTFSYQRDVPTAYVAVK